jgi:hypothetical protein
VVARYDSSRHHRKARVLLVVGARNLGYPEVYLPAWVAASPPEYLAPLLRGQEYREYLEASFAHFAANPLLYGWQAENEPLDDVDSAGGRVDLSPQEVASEISLLRSFDAVHPVVVTTYNSSHVNLDRVGASPLGSLFQLVPAVPKPVGHPQPTLGLADVLGLDLYVVTPSTPLGDASVGERIAWKAQALDYWAQRAAAQGKELWVTEMQASPWIDTTGFEPEDLLASARAYRRGGASMVLLWGVEGWLSDPAWMAAGRGAVRALRSP